jgi:hypothetical protein
MDGPESVGAQRKLESVRSQRSYVTPGVPVPAGVKQSLGLVGGKRQKLKNAIIIRPVPPAGEAELGRIL